MSKQILIENISQRIVELLGLHFPANKSKDLERGVVEAATDLGIDSSLTAIWKWISQPNLSTQEISLLSAKLTVNETYFFREQIGLDYFKNEIIPHLISTRRGKSQKIKIWSAGCSSGEEPYTLAILLKENFPQLSDWEITILATDISPVAIQKALKGEYTNWSFRETNDAIRQKYFTKKENLWRISSEIQKMVTFSYLNLSKNSFPSRLTDTEGVDVIFCRNVLMYFSEEGICAISERFYNALQKGGWLITSQVELNDNYFGHFARVQYQNGIVYCKKERSATWMQKPSKPQEISLKLPMVQSVKSVQKTEVTQRRAHSSYTSQTPKEANRAASAISSEIEMLYLKGQYSQCIEQCKSILQSETNNDTAKRLLAQSYANIGQLDESQYWLEDLLSAKTDSPDVYCLYAYVCREKENLHLAEDCIRKALYLDANHLSANFLMGNIQNVKGNKKGADLYFKKILSMIAHKEDDEQIVGFGEMNVGRVKEMIENIN